MFSHLCWPLRLHLWSISRYVLGGFITGPGRLSSLSCTYCYGTNFYRSSWIIAIRRIIIVILVQEKHKQKTKNVLFSGSDTWSQSSVPKWQVGSSWHQWVLLWPVLPPPVVGNVPADFVITLCHYCGSLHLSIYYVKLFITIYVKLKAQINLYPPQRIPPPLWHPNFWEPLLCPNWSVQPTWEAKTLDMSEL